MATNTGLVDRNTGLPTTASALAASIPYTETKVTGTGPSTERATSTSTERVATSVSQASSSLNTTPGALAALEALITQLSDRPNISQAELDSKFPLAGRVFHPNLGWQFADPKTGNLMTSVEAATFNAKQGELRARATQAAGTTGGGTEAQKTQQTERQTEIGRGRATQDKYTKEAAFTDAQALVNKSIADALEAAMPQIAAQLEGAGTSRSSLAANLTQKAATKGATEGAALGANLAGTYGQISNQLSGVLEMLTRSDPNSPAAMLLQAIIGSKGLVSSSVGSQSQTSEGTKTGTVDTVKSGNISGTISEHNPLSPLPAMVNPGVAASKVSNAPASTNPYYAFSMGPAIEPNVSTGMNATYEQLFANPEPMSLFEIES